MKKEFDEWNEYKKEIHTNGQSIFYQKRDVWWCRLGVNVGYEQDGTGKEFERPVVVMHGFSRHVCLIVPLTTSIKENIYHVHVGNIQGREAYAIVSQIRLIDTKRLLDKIEKLPKEPFQHIQKAIRKFFD